MVKNGEVFQFFIDATKDVASVNCNITWSMLMEIGISYKKFNVIIEFMKTYKLWLSQIVVSQSFHVNYGTMQGC